MRVHLGAFQTGVPKHPLDETDVRAVFQHQRGHAVAEYMTASGQPDIGLAYMAAHSLFSTSAMQGVLLSPPSGRTACALISQKQLKIEISWKLGLTPFCLSAKQFAVRARAH